MTRHHQKNNAKQDKNDIDWAKVGEQAFQRAVKKLRRQAKKDGRKLVYLENGQIVHKVPDEED